MRLFLCIVIILSMFSWLSGFYPLGYHSSLHVKLANEITVKTAKKLKKQKGLSLSRARGEMMNDIQVLSMAFKLDTVADIETARQLLVDSVQEYLSAINSNEEIRPHLRNYPFTPKNVGIAICFYDPYGLKDPSGKLNIARANRGKIVYYASDPKDHTIKPLHEENYEEALKLVEK